VEVGSDGSPGHSHRARRLTDACAVTATVASYVG
jgi:hypothetical protein